MKKAAQIYIFVEKNMGHGFDLAYPLFSLWKLFLFKALIYKCRTGLSKRLGFLIYRHVEIDRNCTDPRAKGRLPQIEMTAIFPFCFNMQNLFSDTGNLLLENCRKIARNIEDNKNIFSLFDTMSTPVNKLFV